MKDTEIFHDDSSPHPAHGDTLKKRFWVESLEARAESSPDAPARCRAAAVPPPAGTSPTPAFGTEVQHPSKGEFSVGGAQPRCEEKMPAPSIASCRLRPRGVHVSQRRLRWTGEGAPESFCLEHDVLSSSSSRCAPNRAELSKQCNLPKLRFP